MTDDFEIAKPGSIYDTSIGMGYMQGELDPTSPRSSIYENPNILGITPLNKGENEFARQEKYGQTPSNDEAVGAGILHIDPNGYGLFVKRSTGGDYSGHWALPGGKIEKGETPFEAAERETIEEVGYVDATEAHGEYNTFSPVHFKTFLKPVGNQFEPNWMNECDDYKWAKLSNPPQPLHPGVEELLTNITKHCEDGYNPNEPRDPNGRWVEEQHVEAAKKHWDDWFEKQNYHEPSYWDMAHTAASMLFKGSKPNKLTGLET